MDINNPHWKDLKKINKNNTNNNTKTKTKTALVKKRDYDVTGLMLGGSYPRRNSCIRINISRWGGTNVAWAKASNGGEGRPCKTSPTGNLNSLCTVLINQSRGGEQWREGHSGWHSIKAIKSFFSLTTHVDDDDEDDDCNPVGNGYGGYNGYHVLAEGL